MHCLSGGVFLGGSVVLACVLCDTMNCMWLNIHCFFSRPLCALRVGSLGHWCCLPYNSSHSLLVRRLTRLRCCTQPRVSLILFCFSGTRLLSNPQDHFSPLRGFGLSHNDSFRDRLTRSAHLRTAAVGVRTTPPLLHVRRSHPNDTMSPHEYVAVSTSQYFCVESYLSAVTHVLPL